MKQIISTSILILGLGFSAFAQNERSVCPTIEVGGDGVVRPEEPINFSVKISDEAKNLSLGYEWTVSQGTIIKGLGSPTITVDTTGVEDTNITATVKIEGLPENCANTVSETGSVAPKLPIEILDEFGKLPNDQVKARMDALLVSLGNNPNYQGYIINYGTDQEIDIREKQIRKAIKFLKYDASRIKLVRGGANPNGGTWTKIWVVYPGTEITP